MFNQNHPTTWTYHRNTSRWTFNPSVANVNREPPKFKEYAHCPSIALPGYEPLSMRLDRCLANRHSCRRFRDAPISLTQLSTILATSYGLGQGHEFDQGLTYTHRPVPSGGGLYPFEVYVMARSVDGIESGVYHYASSTHHLELINSTKLSGQQIADIFLNQAFIKNAAAIVVFAAVVARTMHKYGDRGYRYILIEAGHAAQNANLGCESLGLGSLNIGGFYDDEVSRVFELDATTEVPIYAIAIGPEIDSTQPR